MTKVYGATQNAVSRPESAPGRPGRTLDQGCSGVAVSSVASLEVLAAGQRPS